MEIWKWVLAILTVLLFLSEVISRLTPLGSFLLFLWRQVLMCWHKRRKAFPVEVKFDSLKIVSHFIPDYLEIESKVEIRVTGRRCMAKVDRVIINLDGKEADEKDLTLIDKPIKDLEDGTYILNFTIHAFCRHLAEWSKGNGKTEDVCGQIRIKVGKFVCETKPTPVTERIILK